MHDWGEAHANFFIYKTGGEITSNCPLELLFETESLAAQAHLKLTMAEGWPGTLDRPVYLYPKCWNDKCVLHDKLFCFPFGEPV